MAHTTFTNGVTLTDAAWFQDVDTVAYTLFGNGTSYTGVLTLAGTTQSTSTTTGQAIIAGGMGLAKNLWVGGTGNFAGAVTLQAALTLGGAVAGGGNQIDNVVIGTSTPLAGTFTTATANAFVPNSSTVPANGMYLPAANTLGWATNSTFGMSLASGALKVASTGPTITLNRTNSTTAFGSLNFTGSDDVIDWQISTNNAAASAWEVNQGGGTTATNNRIRVDSNGFFKASNYGTFVAVGSQIHEFNTNVIGGGTLYLSQSHASNPGSGVTINYNASTPNDTGHEFFYAVDSSAQRAAIRSNGGIANYQANDVNLSDLNVKPDFITYADAGDTEKIWNFGKRMRAAWGKWHYEDQTHPDWNNGYGAQLVKAAAGDDFPELVEVIKWGRDDDSPSLHTVYDSDLMHLMGAIVTESQFKIDDLIERVSKLEAK